MLNVNTTSGEKKIIKESCLYLHVIFFNRTCLSVWLRFLWQKTWWISLMDTVAWKMTQTTVLFTDQTKVCLSYNRLSMDSGITNSLNSKQMFLKPFQSRCQVCTGVPTWHPHRVRCFTGLLTWQKKPWMQILNNLVLFVLSKSTDFNSARHSMGEPKNFRFSQPYISSV